MNPLHPAEFSICWTDHRILYYASQGTLQTVSPKTIAVHQIPRDDWSIQTGSKGHSFEPLCLTLFLNRRCNLACKYCYAHNKEETGTTTIHRAAVHAAAEAVAVNCTRHKKVFVVGFHGDNEPLLNPGSIEQSIRMCRDVAERYNLCLVSVCTTNGVIPERIAKWAAGTFQGITLSWDGPDDIHDRQRVHKDGSPTAQSVRRTAALLLQRSGRLQYLRVRTTVTAASVSRLLDVVRFFRERHIRWIDLYPVFPDRFGSLDADVIPDPREFVRNYLKARSWANDHGVRLDYAGTRLADRHQQFCPVLQQSLTITPDGCATACFMASHNHDVQNEPFIYGTPDPKNSGLTFDRDKLDTVLDRMRLLPEQCMRCFNRTHCVRGCPSVCPLDSGYDGRASFDCTIEKWIGLANIIEGAGIELPEEATEDPESFFGRITAEPV